MPAHALPCPACGKMWMAKRGAMCTCWRMDFLRSAPEDRSAFPACWLARWCLGCAGWRWALFVAVLWLGALVGTATAAPFERTFAYTQPDGTAIELWGRGDEFHAVFETLDGYTVVFDPAVKAYFYAELSADGRELRSTGVRVGQAGGAPHGEKHLRIDPAAARAQALARHRVWDEQTKVSQRWAALKAQGRARLAAARDGVALAPPQQPTTGTRTGLCLLVDFPDDEATIPQATVDAMLNGDTFAEFGNPCSVKRYFEEVSGGHFMFTNIVTAYIRAPHPKGYYNDEAKDAFVQGQLLLGDVLAVLKARPDYESTILPALAALDVDGEGACSRPVCCLPAQAAACGRTAYGGRRRRSKSRWRLATGCMFPPTSSVTSAARPASVPSATRSGTWCADSPTCTITALSRWGRGTGA